MIYIYIYIIAIGSDRKSNSFFVAVGETIYAALFDAAPSLQSLFKTARREK